MSRQVLFVQGAGKGTYDEWDQKLVESLCAGLGKTYSVVYPRMPDEADPKPSSWKSAIRSEFGKLRDGDVLVGHSFGGTMLLHVVGEEPPPFRPAALILLATPFYGAGGWDGDALEISPSLVRGLPRGLPVRLYHGTEDDSVPFAHLSLYAQAIPQAVAVTVPHGSHQFNDDLASVAHDISRLLARPLE
jgi:predicted alpha/beta hydrolase family esterase